MDWLKLNAKKEGWGIDGARVVRDGMLVETTDEALAAAHGGGPA